MLSPPFFFKKKLFAPMVITTNNKRASVDYYNVEELYSNGVDKSTMYE